MKQTQLTDLGVYLSLDYGVVFYLDDFFCRLMTRENRGGNETKSRTLIMVLFNSKNKRIKNQ